MLKFYIQPNFKKHRCFICKDEAKLACKFYDGKGIERQLFYCKKCMIIHFMFNTQLNLIKNVKNVIRIPLLV